MININKIELPKYCQMRVSGKKISIEQAKMIIFRTDPFFFNADEYYSNFSEFCEAYRKYSGIDKLVPGIEEETETLKLNAIQEAFGVKDFWFIYNDFGASDYAFGPHGWCYPDGTIFFKENIGPFPEAEDIVETWTNLAKAFPFLELNVTVMDSEKDTDIRPLFNIAVKDGCAKIEDPDLSVHGDTDFDKDDEEIAFISNKSHKIEEMRWTEIGLPLDWYIYFADKIYACIEDFGFIDKKERKNRDQTFYRMIKDRQKSLFESK